MLNIYQCCSQRYSSQIQKITPRNLLKGSNQPPPQICKISMSVGCGSAGAIKNVPKSLNSNNHNKLKMSYILDFLEQHLLSFLQSSMETHRQDQNYLNFTSQHNLFSMVAEMLLFATQGCSPKQAEGLARLVRGKLLIPYQCLQTSPLVTSPRDGSMIQLIKGMQQVYVQMLQLQLRVMLCYIQAAHSQQINNTILNLISEISYIYPLLKAELSINHTTISLGHFLEQVFNQIAGRSVNGVFVGAVERMKEECAFMGVVEKAIDRIVEGFRSQSEGHSKKVDISSNDSEEDAEAWKENFHGCSDNSMLRKKKKIVKEGRAKPDVENRTPTRERAIGLALRLTPRTQKTEDNTVNFDAKSPLKRTPIFKKIKKTVKKPMQRTIYSGQTKKFIPKKSSTSSEHFFEQYLTSSTLINQPISLSFYEPGRRTEKKPNKLEMNDNQVNVFCVPETPRPSLDKKSNPLKKAYSMDFSKLGGATFKI